MNKNISKENKIKQFQKMIIDFELEYTSHNAGLLFKISVDNYIIDFYPTTQTWHDAKINRKGKGIDSFLTYIGKIEPGEYIYGK
jgi:hypothetical protein